MAVATHAQFHTRTAHVWPCPEAPYLKEKLKKQDSDECWWCESGKRQTREQPAKTPNTRVQSMEPGTREKHYIINALFTSFHAF
jgi:hypothetical protein